MLVDNLSSTEPVLPKNIAENKKYKLEEIAYESIATDSENISI